MESAEIKIGLESFTQKFLIELFPSFEFKANESKKNVVAAILDGDPTAEEITAFKVALEKDRAEPGKDKKKAGPPAKVKRDLSEKSDSPEKAGKYEVVTPIKEDGTCFNPGEDYTGRWAARYLKHGQIKKKG